MDSLDFAKLHADCETSHRFMVIYRIYSRSWDEAKATAWNIAIEQSVECPYSMVEGTTIADTIVGKIEQLSPDGPEHYLAVISYTPEAVGAEFTEFINMLFGNSSLQKGVRLIAFCLPDEMNHTFPGPRFGQDGIRQLTGIHQGPILMSAIKPLGTPVSRLARMVYDLACGGCSIIKDDHNLFNQTYAPFEERVRACVEAVNAAYEDSGNRALYVANCNGDGEESIQRAWKARELGADGVMISPGLCGFGPLFRLSSNPDFSLPLFLHPSFAGPLTASDEAGITPFCYFGQLARLSGADASVFTSFSGRFSYTREECQSIARAAGMDMNGRKAMFPVPAGGMKWQLFPVMHEVYGSNTIFLVGGNLLTHSDSLKDSDRFFRAEIDKLNS